MCSTDVYCSKQTGSSSTKGNHHPSFLRFWNWAENCRCSQNLCVENVVKTETQQTFVNGLLSFITLGIYTPLEAWHVCSQLIAWVAHRYGQLYLHNSFNILLGSFQLFLHSDQPLWGWNNPVQRCLPVGGGCIIHAGGGSGFTHWLTDCFDVQPTTTSGNIITRASFSALASANSFTCILHRAQQHHDASTGSNLPRSLVTKFSGIFVALGFVGNGVITVMINSPWQADDDADNQEAGDNRGDSAHTSNIWPFRPSLNLQSGCQPCTQTTITSARQATQMLLPTVDCLTDITTINHR